MRPLEDIERDAAAATPGPWMECAESGEWWMQTDPDEPDTRTIIIPDTGVDMMTQEDVDFIAHARTDVPEMAAEIRRLRAFLADRC